jgi:hypothetical protein
MLRTTKAKELNMTDFQSISESYERRCQAVARANDRNKGVLFDTLAAASITSVTVSFDGEGDSGQIEEIMAYFRDEVLSTASVQYAEG